jgi:hypothetical protein
MNRNLLMAAAVLAMGIAPALAEDGRVPRSTLTVVGLGGMHVLTDAQGLQVRGLSSNAASGGSSLIVGQLVYNDANGTQVVFGSDFNTSRGTSENAGLNAVSTAQHTQGSGLILTIGPIVNGGGLVFQGALTGQAGQVTLPGLAGSGFATGF